MDLTENKLRETLARHQAIEARHAKRLARRIHDEISQKMTLLSLQLSLASTDDAPPPNWSQNCQTWGELVLELGQAIRDVTAELQPRVLDETALKPALRWLVQSSAKNINCSLTEPREELVVPVCVGNELFVLCREILTEVLIPAKVAKVDIGLGQKDGVVQLILSVAEPASAREILSEKALRGIAINDRLAVFQGTVEYPQASAVGSTLVVSVPVGKTTLSHAA